MQKAQLLAAIAAAAQANMAEIYDEFGSSSSSSSSAILISDFKDGRAFSKIKDDVFQKLSNAEKQDYTEN